MKERNLKIALVAMTFGTVLLLVSVTPLGPTLPCLMTDVACAQFYQIQALANLEYFEFWFSMGSVLMGVAIALLYLGREKPVLLQTPTPST